MDQQKFHAGMVIFRAGDPGDRGYLIHEGAVELLRGPADRPVRVAQLGPGEVFGEMALVEERPHSLTALAKTAVKVSALTRDEFERSLTADPATFRIYLKTLFERLRTLSARAGSHLEPIRDEFIPEAMPGVSVTIHPLTRKAAETLPEDGLLIGKFPFRIGRASEDRELEPLDLNDLWLLDRVPFHVSRNHVDIDLDGDRVLVKDRGSSRGLYVNDTPIGGNSKERQIALEDGDNVLIVGGRLSPYQFRIHVVHD